MSTEALAADPNAAPPSNQPPPSQPSNGTTASWSDGWIKNGKFDHTAFEKAPEELRPLAKEMALYPTPEAFLKSHLSAREMASKKGLFDPLPANATPEQQAERAASIRKVNGAPDKPEGYGLAKPEGVPDNMWDQKYADSVAAVALKHGLPPAAVKELAQVELSYVQGQQKAQAEADAKWYEGQDKLYRENLAKEGLDYAKGQDLVQRAARKWGVAADNPLLKNATVLMLLTRLGLAGKEDELIKGELESLGLNTNMSAEQASAAAYDIMRNKDNPLYEAFKNKSHVDHDAAVKKWNAYNKIEAAAKKARNG